MKENLDLGPNFRILHALLTYFLLFLQNKPFTKCFCFRISLIVLEKFGLPQMTTMTPMLWV